jgi:hypothetical protein
MKKIVPHILFFLLTFSAYSQGVFFNLGKNFSSFSYRNRSSYAEKMKINGIGDAYELGYTAPLKYKNLKELKYTGSLTLNEYNALGVSPANRLAYTTAYLGVQNTLDYQFYESFYFFVSARAGLNVATILRGKQEVDNSVYNLVHQKEFSGLVIRPMVGVYAKYYLTKTGYLSAGFNFSKGVKVNNSSDNVSINNSQIVFGGYFDLIKR